MMLCPPLDIRDELTADRETLGWSRICIKI
jgi:hypothetical protein